MVDIPSRDDMTGLKPFLESSLDDASGVVCDMFSASSGKTLVKYLQNPDRAPGASVGDVAYEKGKVVGFQAAIPRRMYLKGRPFLGIVGGMLAMREGASPVLLMKLMKTSIASRDGSRLFVGNTANVKSMKMNRLLGVRGKGPATCERIRFTPIWFPPGLRRLLPRPCSRRMETFSSPEVASFWQRYLETQAGLVTSRTVEELDWVFGARMKTGEVVALGDYDDGRLNGYIALRSTHGGRRWLIVDWIALKDDPAILDRLLKSAVRWLRRETTAWVLESIGFPESAERILKRHLPLARRTPNNSFVWKFLEGEQVVPEGSWFFGPYDGDRCL